MEYNVGENWLSTHFVLYTPVQFNCSDEFMFHCFGDVWTEIIASEIAMQANIRSMPQEYDTRYNSQSATESSDARDNKKTASTTERKRTSGRQLNEMGEREEKRHKKHKYPAHLEK